jgi:hypothetical protein
MSLMPEKMRAILENGTSPIIKKSSVPGEAFQAGYYAHQFHQLFTTTKKLGTKNSSTSLTTKYQRSLKTSRSRMYFPYSQC